MSVTKYWSKLIHQIILFLLNLLNSLKVMESKYTKVWYQNNVKVKKTKNNLRLILAYEFPNCGFA